MFSVLVLLNALKLNQSIHYPIQGLLHLFNVDRCIESHPHWVSPKHHLHGHHDHVIKWKHSALLALCAWSSLVTGEFPTQRPVTGALMFSLICAWISSWANNHEAVDLRRHRTHYDVIVVQVRPMILYCWWHSHRAPAYSSPPICDINQGFSGWHEAWGAQGMYVTFDRSTIRMKGAIKLL